MNSDLASLPTAPCSPRPADKVGSSEPIAKWLASAELLKYRANYRNFRIGQAVGARGDISDVGFAHFSKSICPPQNEDDAACDPITQWRLAYRRYRLGAAHGAKGSLDAVASRIDSIDLLPIVQAFNLKRHLVRSKPTAANADAASSSSLPTPSRSPLHVHFGGGKLGIGLILSALMASDTPFVIVQSDRGVYSSLSQQVRVVVNDTASYTLNTIYADDTSATHLLDQALQDAANNNVQGLLLLSPRDSASTIKQYLYTQKATSFSCSVGPGVPSLASELRDVRLEGVPLYACENDHAAVTRLSESLTQKGSTVSVLPCMVDRICTRLERASDELIQAETEPFAGEIVLLEQQSLLHGGSLPLSGPTLRVPRIDAQAKYFAERKFLLVNGGHTVLAFLTLLRKKQSDPDASPWTPPGHFPLLDWNTMDARERSIFWSFSLARLLLITWEYDTEVLKNAHGVETDQELCEELLKYARDTIHRFSAVPDYTSRILAAGVDNRYLGRLKNVLDFLEVTNPTSSEVGGHMLKQAGVMYCGVVALVHQLVEEAYQFTRQVERLSFGVTFQA